MEKYLDVTIAGISGLVGVVFGFFLQIVSNWLSERKHIREEFYEIKNAIYSTTVENNLFSELLKLKRFFIRRPKFLKNKENNYFFHTWLMEPLVEEAFTGVGYWNKEKSEKMYKNLEETKL